MASISSMKMMQGWWSLEGGGKGDGTATRVQRGEGSAEEEGEEGWERR